MLSSGEIYSDFVHMSCQSISDSSATCAWHPIEPLQPSPACTSRQFSQPSPLQNFACRFPVQRTMASRRSRSAQYNYETVSSKDDLESVRLMDSAEIDISSPFAQVGKLPLPMHTEPLARQLNVNPQTLGTNGNVPKTSEQNTSTAMDQNTVFWDAYNTAGDLEDKEFVKTSGVDLDALLIFAGLFSATNTAFIIESCKTLKADPLDETNKLLRSMYNATMDPSHAAIDATPFVASSRDIRINACFFASLCCSLSAAFGAVLAKQWLTQYDLDGGGSLKEPAARGRERQLKYEGRHWWRLEDVVVTLPTLLQFSLFFFFIGVVDLLWPLNDIVTGIALGFTITTFIFYITTITISLFDKSAPFQTRLSLLIRSSARRTRAFLGFQVSSQAKAKPETDINCFMYLFDRMTKPENVGIFAEAFVSLSGALGSELHSKKITETFIDIYLKPSLGQIWSLPRLYGPNRFPLLKMLNVLLTKWRDLKKENIHTPLYDLEMVKFSSTILGELPKTFLANPADPECCQCIIDILLNLNPIQSTSSDAEIPEWQQAWLAESVTRRLVDKEPTIQRNTLTMLNITIRGSAQRKSAWDIVRKAACRSPALGRIIHSTVWAEIPTIRPAEAQRDLGSYRLLDWMLMADDMDGLAGALEALPQETENSVEGGQLLIGTVMDRIIMNRLKPTRGSWWHLPGLHGLNTKSMLRVLHVILVKWKHLETDLGHEATPFRLNSSSFIASLRAELWEAHLAALEDSDVAKMITDICSILPPPVPIDDDDDISTVAMRKVGTDMAALYQDEKAKPMALQHCFSIMCSNADSLIAFANFHAIRLPSRGCRAISEHLRSTMWVEEIADLEDFWTTTFRVQLLPIWCPSELQEMRFMEYLDIWFRHFVKPDVETPLDGQAPNNPTARDRVRQTRLYWTYILSLRQLLVTTGGQERSRELKQHNHQSHLLEILGDVHCHSYTTSAPLALHTFLRLWSDDRFDLSYISAKGVKGVTNVLASGDLPLSLISLDFRMYTESSRVGDTSHEEWSEEVSRQVVQDMGQMLKWLRSYLEAAMRGDLVELQAWGKIHDRYARWCSGMDEQSGTDEYGKLSEDLRDVVAIFFKDAEAKALDALLKT